jgi:hypothetical protein
MYENQRFIKFDRRPRKLINYVHKKSSDLVLGGFLTLFGLIEQVGSMIDALGQAQYCYLFLFVSPH